MVWVGLVYNMLWVGLGLYFGGLGWVGFQKVGPCPCLDQIMHPQHFEANPTLSGLIRKSGLESRITFR